jgi:RNA-directed DNA polymerase
MGNAGEMSQDISTNQSSVISWNLIDWGPTIRGVVKLQQKIFRDAQVGNLSRMRKYQKLLVRSKNARLWAVKIVTEENPGRNTPGVDGFVCRTESQKEQLAESLRVRDYHPSPVRVVMIPKPDGSKRRLGIPTVKDRAMQALVKFALEGEWEAKFEPHSFGFRPGRSAIDATHHLYWTLLQHKNNPEQSGWVLDADISKCFDMIDHRALLCKLGAFPFCGIIQSWLKSGAISKIGFEKTPRGTPQGGIISPLLANIALDGMERLFGIYSRSGRYVNPSKRVGLNKNVSLYRYADDFVVIAPTREVIESYVKPTLVEFLAGVGLNFSASKTAIRHITEGFSFLGFRFQRYNRCSGAFKRLMMQPDRERIDRFLQRLKEFTRTQWNTDVKALIRGMNRRIRGACNYYRWSNTSRIFPYMGHRIVEILMRWAQRKHNYHRGKKWLRKRYWIVTDHSAWTFSWDGIQLVDPYEYTVLWWKYARVRIESSPLNMQENLYWNARNNKRKRSYDLHPSDIRGTW